MGYNFLYSSLEGRRKMAMKMQAQILAMKYLMALNENQIRTKCLSTGVVTLTGNVSSQLVRTGKVDASRLSKFVLTSVVLTPLVHYFNKFSTKLFKSVKSKLLKAILKVAFDQLVVSPIITGLFHALLAVEDGDDPAKRVEQKWQLTMRFSWPFWTVGQFVNQFYVPPPFRVLFENLLNFFWTFFLTPLSTPRRIRNTQRRLY